MAKNLTEIARSNRMTVILKGMHEAHDLAGTQIVRFCSLVADYLGLAKNHQERKCFVNEVMGEFDMDKSGVYRAERNGKAYRALEGGKVSNWPQMPDKDSQLRPLALLLDRGDSVICEAWDIAIKMSKEADEPLTAVTVAEAVDTFLPIEDVTEPAGDSQEVVVRQATDVLQGAIRRLTVIAMDLGECDETLVYAALVQKVIGAMREAKSLYEK